MIFDPSIMALILVSAIVSSMLIIAAGFSIQILRFWDIQSGSEQQLSLERRTYLISTLLIWALSFEFLSLLLFIYNAESMSGQFVGAMCATGVLNVNSWGWPTLVFKIALFFFAAAWLALNYLDNRGYDYPLIRYKYGLLLFAIPLAISESILQWLHFNEMDPNLITSCCGTLFSAEAEGVAAEISGMPPGKIMPAFILSAVLVLFSALWVALKGRKGWLLSFAGLAAFCISLIAIVSFISLYIYEHPHHHCPFCILKQGHDYIGYFLYIPLFLAAGLSLSVGVISPWKNIPSLTVTVTQVVPRLSWLSIMLFIQFYLTAAWSVWQSNLTMQEVWW
ncbi:MAG: hypothetical protein ABW139_17540 [Candidatus Thiodiazotropha sp. DIVDIV]